MAYTMTHILIAEKVMEYFDCPIDYSTYMVGTITPDAVHANPDYSRELKKKSHVFAEGLVWGEVTGENELEDWFDCVKEFYVNNYFKYDRDFFLGYIVHILTDICSCREIYALFIILLQKTKWLRKRSNSLMKATLLITICSANIQRIKI